MTSLYDWTAHDVFKAIADDDGFFHYMAQLAFRWYAEKDHENINDYLEVIRNAVKEKSWTEIEGCDVQITKIRKRPFSIDIRVQCGDQPAKTARLAITARGRASLNEVATK